MAICLKFRLLSVLLLAFAIISVSAGVSAAQDRPREGDRRPEEQARPQGDAIERLAREMEELRQRLRRLEEENNEARRRNEELQRQLDEIRGGGQRPNQGPQQGGWGQPNQGPQGPQQGGWGQPNQGPQNANPEQRERQMREAAGMKEEIEQLQIRLRELKEEYSRVVEREGEENDRARELRSLAERVQAHIDELMGNLQRMDQGQQGPQGPQNANPEQRERQMREAAGMKEEIEQLQVRLREIKEEYGRVVEREGEVTPRARELMAEAERLQARVGELMSNLQRLDQGDQRPAGPRGPEARNPGQPMENPERHAAELEREIDMQMARLEELRARAEEIGSRVGGDNPDVRRLREEIANAERRIDELHRERERAGRDEEPRIENLPDVVHMRGEQIETEIADIESALERLYGQEQTERRARRIEELERRLEELYDELEGLYGTASEEPLFDNPELNEIVEIAYSQDRFKEGIDRLRRFLREHPDNQDARDLLAEMERDEVEFAIDQALDQAYDLIFEQDRPDAGFRVLDDLIAKFPDREDLRDLRREFELEWQAEQRAREENARNRDQSDRPR
ncbi:MAG: hypothetical protein NUW37_00085 [Planctomycetes bacterium]|nr:hypothetical protein [Planctomycetota bacterium]